MKRALVVLALAFCSGTTAFGLKPASKVAKRSPVSKVVAPKCVEFLLCVMSRL